MKASVLGIFLWLAAIGATGQQSMTQVSKATGQQIMVGPNTQVSKANANRDHFEVILAADPNDAKHLLAASMVLDPEKPSAKGAYNVVTYVTFDGGQTWSPTLEVGKAGGFWGDPATAIGCDGTAYSVALAVIGAQHQNQTLVYRSRDGGKTWLPPVSLPYSDREYITVDCASSKYRGRVYIHGNVVMRAADGARISGTRVWKSEDGGESFRETIFPPAAGRFSSYQGAGVVLTDGTFLAPFTDMPSAAISPDASGPPRNEGIIRVFRTEDGGNSFSNAMSVSKVSRPAEPNVGLPNLAADQTTGPFRDRVYATWADGASGRSEVVLAYSSDKGKTWSKPVVVNDDERPSGNDRGPDNFMPVVAVNRQGVVGVSWYTWKNRRTDQDWKVRFSASLDGGKTFLPSVEVSESAFTHDWSKPLAVDLLSLGGGDFEESLRGDVITVFSGPNRAYSRGGDTAGLAAGAEGSFHPLWIDNRTGTPQVWTAAVTVNGTAMRNGRPEFEGLQDVTRKVALEWSHPRYDPQTRLVSGKAYLVNTSDETLSGPLLVRLVRFGSGRAEAVNADNHEQGKGAVWDFTAALQNGKLAPGERTNAKDMTFRVVEQKELEPKVYGRFFGFDAEVLGRVNLR